ncbi:hypothetical protein ACL02P_06495 [Paenibacillus sp. MB22_1]|uniref:hypothetical protein n=1 Tax=Paenibacillus sp. MB22_1 TaxID=3383121 RepID=UPI0039A1E5E1
MGEQHFDPESDAEVFRPMIKELLDWIYTDMTLYNPRFNDPYMMTTKKAIGCFPAILKGIEEGGGIPRRENRGASSVSNRFFQAKDASWADEAYTYS